MIQILIASLFILLSGHSFASDKETNDITQMLEDNTFSTLDNLVIYSIETDRNITISSIKKTDLQDWKRSRYCRSSVTTKCWFTFRASNQTSLEPTLRLNKISNRGFTLYQIPTKGSIQVIGHKRFELKRTFKHKQSNAVTLVSLNFNTADVYLEYPENKEVLLSGFIINNNKYYSLIKSQEVVELIYLIVCPILIFLGFLFSTPESRKSKTLGLIIYYVSCLILFEGYRGSDIFQSSFTSEPYLILESKYWVLLEVIYVASLLEMAYLYTKPNSKVLLRSILIVNASTLVLLVKFEIYNQSLSLLNLTSTILVIAFHHRLTNHSAARTFFYRVTSIIALVIILLIVSSPYIHIYLIPNFDSTLALFLLLSILPMFLVLNDLKQAKVVTIGQYKRLLDDSLIDFMTGLYNRKKFDSDVIAGHYKHIYYLDCNRFKKVNDEFGHNVGDRKLIELAKKLESLASPTGKVYRLGGDEFAILTTVNIDPMRFENKQVGSTPSSPLSFAVGHYKSNNTLRFEDVYKAEYCSRQAKDNPDLFNTWLDSEQEVVMYCLDSMRRDAIDLISPKHIVCYEQQIVEADSLQVRKVELLCRLKDHIGKIHSAFQLLEIVNAHSLHTTLDTLMAFYAQQRLAQSDESFMVAINTSPGSIKDTQFIEYLREIAQCHPQRFGIEITEHSFYEADTVFLSNIQQLKDAGVTIALDDFGSGYSSYSILSTKYYDEVKIDGMLISRICEDEFSHDLVEGIVTLCHKVGYKVTAEFVENQPILEKLQRMGVDYLQGYYIDIPSASQIKEPEQIIVE